MIGGGESGGYGFRGHVPERDGILAGLYFLDFMIKTRKTPSQLLAYLFSKVGPHYYDRIDAHISPDDRQKYALTLTGDGPILKLIVLGLKLADRPNNPDTTDGYKFWFEDDSWLLIRFSGTEPLVRIYAEGHSPEQVHKILESGKTILGGEL
jgi:phosphomannomutase